MYFYQICVSTYVMLNTIDSPLRNLVTLQPSIKYNLRSDNDNYELQTDKSDLSLCYEAEQNSEIHIFSQSKNVTKIHFKLTFISQFHI